MTTHELRKIREQMQQSPRSMADHLGININTYYGWERGSPIPPYFALAIKYLATLDLPKAATARYRGIDTFRTKASPGARFGRLVVVGAATKSGVSRHRKVKVQCDCGAVKEMRASNLFKAVQCGNYCSMKFHPMPGKEGNPVPHHIPGLPSIPVDVEDPDAPDLDAPDIEWRIYHDRKEKELAALDATTTPAPEEDEWEAGL